MSQYYIILHMQEMDDAIKQCVEQNAHTKVVDIYDMQENPKPTGYCVAPVPDGQMPSLLKPYRKFNEEEVKVAIDNIKNGNNVQRFVLDRIKMSAFSDPEGKRARFTGGFKMNIPAGETVTQDYLITEDRFVTGAKYWVEGSNFGDKVDFDVIHPVYGISLDKFIANWYVWDGSEQLDTYPAKLVAGLILRVTYYNTGVDDAKFIVNMFLHKV